MKLSDCRAAIATRLYETLRSRKNSFRIEWAYERWSERCDEHVSPAFLSLVHFPDTRLPYTYWKYFWAVKPIFSFVFNQKWNGRRKKTWRVRESENESVPQTYDINAADGLIFITDLIYSCCIFTLKFSYARIELPFDLLLPTEQKKPKIYTY